MGFCLSGDISSELWEVLVLWGKCPKAAEKRGSAEHFTSSVKLLDTENELKALVCRIFQNTHITILGFLFFPTLPVVSIVSVQFVFCVCLIKTPNCLCKQLFERLALWNANWYL